MPPVFQTLPYAPPTLPAVTRRPAPGSDDDVIAMIADREARAQGVLTAGSGGIGAGALLLLIVGAVLLLSRGRRR